MTKTFYFGIIPLILLVVGGGVDSFTRDCFVSYLSVTVPGREAPCVVDDKHVKHGELVSTNTLKECGIQVRCSNGQLQGIRTYGITDAQIGGKCLVFGFGNERNRRRDIGWDNTKTIVRSGHEILNRGHDIS